ncbi:MAG: acetyl-CoA carboxylase carboxyltransferase subunit alpha [Alphaproteobacteria bacterium]|nr:acetyl-CoA carboxylase carboxyltransferase subunit alpha [Alphaproteobacteria bacterium]
MMILDFEKDISELENKIKELKLLSCENKVDIGSEIEKLSVKLEKHLKSTYEKLTPEQKVQVARHPDRPHTKDYIEYFVEDFMPIAGDRLFSEDEAIISGIGRIGGVTCMILGQEKGSDTESRIKHNFGMTCPEGYRKAQRLMQLADRYNIPVITLVDTAGAYPGLGAEERGQAEAIAKSMEVSFDVQVPIISVVIGEGGSGGAIAIATANKVIMLENSVYSVISPEGCASILWRSGKFTKDAANALRLTAKDLKELGIIDEIIKEPIGGAHRFRNQMMDAVKETILASLKSYENMSREEIREDRRNKFFEMTK